LSTTYSKRLVGIGLSLAAACAAFALGTGGVQPASAQLVASAADSQATLGSTATDNCVAEIVKEQNIAKRIRWKKARVSWYGPGFYGNGMAGGGKLRRNSMVVAHRSLPFGTKVKIKYRGKTVTAVVRDRGPFIHGRTFDLGPGTAKKLGFSGVGTIKYTIQKKAKKKKVVRAEA